MSSTFKSIYESVLPGAFYACHSKLEAPQSQIETCSPVADLAALVESRSTATDRGFVCLVCGSTLANKKSLKRHFGDRHQQTVPYLCPVCQKEFRNRNSFGTHISLYHKDLKGMDLETCAKRSKMLMKARCFHIWEATA